MDINKLTQLRDALNATSNKSFVDTSVVLTAKPNDEPSLAGLSPTAAKKLGIESITLLVICPDGHIGLRADRDHLHWMSTYQHLLSGNGQ